MVLYQQLNPATETQFALWLARLPVILLWLGLGIVVWRWAEMRTTAWGGAMAATVFSFEPTFLGHGHLITTDVAVAAGMTLTLWLATRLVAKPSWSSVILLALSFGLTQLTKYSALILWPALFSLFAIAATGRQAGWTWKWWRRTLGATIVISAALTWTVYGFERLPPSADPRIDRLWYERDALAGSPQLAQLPGPIQSLVKATPPGSGLRNWLNRASTFPIPAYSYWRGFIAVASHNAVGHVAYLLGEQKSTGWWYYFPIAAVVKTPLPLLLLFGAAGYAAAQRWRQLGEPHYYLLYGPIVLYAGWSLTSKINIGIRHLLPLYPLLIIATAHLVRVATRRWQKIGLTIAVLALPIVTLLAWPNTIGYFNALGGGTAGGHRIILDSNLDWNQDLWRLRDYLKTNGTPPAMIALFGSVPVEVVHPNPTRIPTDPEVATTGRPRGLVIISKGVLYSVDLPFRWLRTIAPSARIGSSILVYDFR